MQRVIHRFRNFPIQRKISFVILLTCSTALGVAAAGIFFAQLLTFRNHFTRDLKAIGEMIGHNCTAAITFKDRKDAEEILSAVSAKPYILRASIDLLDGSEFARFQAAGSITGPAVPKADGFHFAGRYLLLNEPVILTGERIATLHLVCDYQSECGRSLRLYATILGVVLMVSVLLALLLSNRLQRLISAPILNLAATAQHVAEKKNYSLRAPCLSKDEVGHLTEAFNDMLARIETHDSSLREANQSLQREIEERKRTEAALLESRQRYEVAVLGSSDGLWDWDLVRGNYYFSPRWKGMIGYADEELANARESWENRLHPDDRDRVLRRLEDYLAAKVASFDIEFRFQRKDASYIWILSRGAALRDEMGQAIRFAGSHTDITTRKEAEEEIDKLHKQLLLTSREAGMAEVATGVLHNVGNVLNSVNVSVNLVQDRLTHSHLASLGKTASLLDSHKADLGVFITEDPKGKLVPEFLSHLAVELENERGQLTSEMQTIVKNVEHIKEIVAMQQSYAKVAGVTEDLPAVSLIEDALRMNSGAFLRHGVTVQREFSEVPPVRVDKHKVLQILVNLFRNAKYAMDAAGRTDKILTLGVYMNGNGRVKLSVRDNGVGIEQENLTRIFGHGFTTKRDGHGFGLHSGALAAKEMGGTLQAYSNGPGKGATFVLELPIVTGKITDHEQPL